MEKSILSRVGFMTQEDKSEFDRNFGFLLSKTEKLERDVVDLNAGMSRLEKKLDNILSSITNSQTDILNVSADTKKKLEIQNSVINEAATTISEVKNNLRIFNQSERQLIKEIDSKLSLQLKSQFDEIHYLQYNLQRIQQSTETIEKNIPQELDLLNKIQVKITEQQKLISELNSSLIIELKQFLNNLNENQLTKSDLHVLESFLRLIAANQMIQETYLNITEDSSQIHPI